jgi:hypothetical protein
MKRIGLAQRPGLARIILILHFQPTGDSMIHRTLNLAVRLPMRRSVGFAISGSGLAIMLSHVAQGWGG